MNRRVTRVQKRYGEALAAEERRTRSAESRSAGDGKMSRRIVASAPGRCGLTGNPSDMYGGSVLSCATRERAICALTTDTPTLRVTNGGETAEFADARDLELRGDNLDIARAALAHFGLDPARTRFALELTTEIPMRAGLAGSTALLAAIVGTMDNFLGLGLSRYQLAETTRRIEARGMGIVCGLQDQHMAVFGGLNFMNFAGKQDLEQRDDEPLATVEPLSEFAPAPPIALVLAHTGVAHHSGRVHQTPRERWLAGEPLVRGHYALVGELAWRAKRALLERDWPRLGALMNENHRLVAELGGSGPANETLIAAARDAGALGAKLAGAGGGGTILALTDDAERISAALLAAGAERLLTPAPSPGLTVAITPA